MKKTIIFVLGFFLVLSMCTAQKVGHLNLGNILAEMPEAGRADSTLILYQKQESMKGDTIAKLFEKEYKVFVDAYNAGTLSPSQTQKRQEELQKQQRIIQAYAKDVEQKVEVLRQQLLQPILAKLDAAIKEVGKVGKYDAILDVSSGFMLYAQESEDIAPLVREKLGLKSK